MSTTVFFPALSAAADTRARMALLALPFLPLILPLSS
jgi:hypothetical protein